MSIKDGGPAFPTFTETRLDVNSNETVIYKCDGGMSLRDYFAAKIASTYAINDSIIQWSIENRHKAKDVVAKVSYEFADAMIAARDKKL